MSAIPRRVGRYELRDRVGRGGMGACYRALDLSLNRWVAVKLLHGEFDSSDARARFAREARAAASLKHGNIVTIHDFGEEDGAPYIVMEFIEGDTLARMIRRGPAPLVQAVRLLEGLCAGLAYAHRAGVVHRDVKPQNLMVDADGSLKILDFGIARMTGSVLTKTSGVIGTPGYMSPEQIQGESVDRRSDIFGAGAVAYELISGCEAFSGETSHAIMNAVLHDDPRPLSEVNPGAAVLEAAVRRALHKKPDERYQNAETFGQDLERIRKRLEEAGDETRSGTAFSTRKRPPSSQRPHDDEAVRDAPAPPVPPRRGTDPEALAVLRAAQIQSSLERARHALAVGDYESALEHCTYAATYDETHLETLDLLERVRLALDERDAGLLLDDARFAYQRDDLSRAIELVQRARALRPDIREATRLDDQIRQRLAEQERLRQRDAKRDALVRAAREALDGDDAEQARTLAAQALALDPSAAAAADVEKLAAARLEQRRREDALRRATSAIQESRREFAGGSYEQALGRLRSAASHPDVDAALQELTERLAQIQASQHQARLLAERLRREDEERAALEREAAARAEREEAERARREDDARVAREREAAARAQHEEAERARRDEEAERARREDEAQVAREREAAARVQHEEADRARREDEARAARERETAERVRPDEGALAAMAVAGGPPLQAPQSADDVALLPLSEETRHADRGEIEPAPSSVIERTAVAPAHAPALELRKAFLSDSFIGSQGQVSRGSLSVSTAAHLAAVAAIVFVVASARPTPPVPPEPIVFVRPELPTPPVLSPTPPPPRQSRQAPRSSPPEPVAVIPPAPVEPEPEVVPLVPPPEVVPERIVTQPVPDVPTEAPRLTAGNVGPSAEVIDIGTADRPVVDLDQVPVVIRQGRVTYPSEALKQRVGGIVEVSVVVDPAGKVVRSRLVKSVRLLDDAARDTAEQYIFRPARVRGRAVYSEVILEITFAVPRL